MDVIEINLDRLIIVILPNLLFFIDMIISILLVYLFNLPFFLIYSYNVWRLIQLIIGYVLTIIGTIFLTWGTLSIGVSRAEGKEISIPSQNAILVISRAYAFVRHPITLGFIYAIFGVGLVFDSTILMILAIIYIPKMILLLIYEEYELMKRFGNKYARYRDKVPFLFPRFRRSHKE